MTGIRDDRAAAVRRYYRDLTDDLERALPKVLDALEAIDAKHGQGEPLTVRRADDVPSDAEIEAYIARNPRVIEVLYAKPPARRRTARKET